MYRVLVSDTTQTELDSLGNLLEREFPGQIELCPASSLSAALESCRQRKVDIALGLASVEGIRDENPSLVFVDRPAGEIDGHWLSACMRNAMSAVDIGRLKERSDGDIRDKLGSVAAIVESDLIYSLIFPSSESEDIRPYFDFFGITERAHYFMTVDFSALDGERRRAYATFRAFIPDFSPCVVGPLMNERSVVFVPFREGIGAESDKRRIMGEVVPFHALLRTHVGDRLKIGVGRVSGDLSRASLSWDESLRALSSVPDSGGVSFCPDETSGAAGTAYVGPYPDAAELRLLERASAGDPASVRALFGEICDWIECRHPDDLSVLRGKLFELVVLVRHRTREILPRFGGFSAWKDTLRTLESLGDAPSLRGFALERIEECTAGVGENRRNRMSPTIVRACAIIHDGLSDDISLEDIARRVEISPFYFSKLFKEETGENFIDYVTMARIRRAKELLVDPALSVKEISGSTGYSDPNYFSKLFKRIVGLTPTEYRESV
jgi:two-component system, response regulator YesN